MCPVLLCHSLYCFVWHGTVSELLWFWNGLSKLRSRRRYMFPYGLRDDNPPFLSYPSPAYLKWRSSCNWDINLSLFPVSSLPVLTFRFPRFIPLDSTSKDFTRFIVKFLFLKFFLFPPTALFIWSGTNVFEESQSLLSCSLDVSKFDGSTTGIMSFCMSSRLVYLLPSSSTEFEDFVPNDVVADGSLGEQPRWVWGYLVTRFHVTNMTMRMAVITVLWFHC